MEPGCFLLSCFLLSLLGLDSLFELSSFTLNLSLARSNFPLRLFHLRTKLLICLSKKLHHIGFIPVELRSGELERNAKSEEPLLRAVVQVPLDAPPLAGHGVKDLLTLPGELLDALL